MNLPQQLIIVRHAESERNKALNGALFINDPTLFEKIGKIPDHKIGITEKGCNQAEQVGQKIATLFNPDIVFHSGYRRTRETAEGILSKYDTKNFLIQENLSLREREGGYTHVLLEHENKEYFPYLQDYWNVVGGLFARPVGGESLMDVIEQRLKPFLKEQFEKYPDKTILLVTHGRVIQCLRFILDEMTWEEMEDFLSKEENTPTNCGVTVYEKDSQNNKLKLTKWNEVYWEE